jgi:hypothetical protein
MQSENTSEYQIHGSTSLTMKKISFILSGVEG